MGGFKIKWLDDTSLLVVFNDAGTAKRAYLQTLCSPPPALFDNNSMTVIKPYDGLDAQQIIQNVNSRHVNTASRGHNSRASVSGANGNGHSRMASASVRGQMRTMNGSIPEHPSVSIPNGSGNQMFGREPSPTLPSIPSQPTLNSLISSTFGEESILNDPAVLAASGENAVGAGPRIGDPGKRMLGAALGMRHPAFGPRHLGGGNPGVGGDQALMKEVTKVMGGLVVSE